MIYLAEFLLVLFLSAINSLPVSESENQASVISDSVVCQAPGPQASAVDLNEAKSEEAHGLEKRLAVVPIDHELVEKDQTRKIIRRRQGQNTEKRSVSQHLHVGKRSPVNYRKKRLYKEKEIRKRRVEPTEKRNDNPKLKELVGHDNPKSKYHQPKDESGNREREKREKTLRETNAKKEGNVKKKEDLDAESKVVSDSRKKREPVETPIDSPHVEDLNDQEYYGDAGSQEEENDAFYSNEVADEAIEKLRERREPVARDDSLNKENALARAANMQPIEGTNFKDATKRQNSQGDGVAPVQDNSAAQFVQKVSEDDSKVEKREDGIENSQVQDAGSVAQSDIESREKRQGELKNQEVVPKTQEEESQYDNRQYDGEGDYYYDNSAETANEKNDVKRGLSESQSKTKLEKKIDLGPGGDEDYEEAAIMNEGHMVTNKRHFVLGGKDYTSKESKVWDEWTSWSPCSARCGIGKSISWRHCKGGSCEPGDKEAKIRLCNTQAC